MQRYPTSTQMFSFSAPAGTRNASMHRAHGRHVREPL